MGDWSEPRTWPVPDPERALGGRETSGESRRAAVMPEERIARLREAANERADYSRAARDYLAATAPMLDAIRLEIRAASIEIANALDNLAGAVDDPARRS